MPLYDYHCTDCGGFRSWRRMSECDDDAVCPACDRHARRCVTAPSLALMANNNRIAHSRNEKSADQPEVIAKSTTANAAAGQHVHTKGGHCHGHGHQKSNLGHSHGRPWMIGH